MLNLDMKFRQPSNNANHNINFIQTIILKYKYHTRIAANENYVNPFTKTTFCFSKKDLRRKRRKRNKKVKNPEKSYKSSGIPMKLIMECIDLLFSIMNEGFSFCPQNGTLFTYSKFQKNDPDHKTVAELSKVYESQMQDSIYV